MPDFMILGAVKAGTTSLYHYLGQHPGIQMSRDNWPRFFHVDGSEPDFERLADLYGSELLAESRHRFRLMCHSGVSRRFEEYESFWEPRDHLRLSGEVSPTYLHDPVVPARIKRRFPNIKVVVVLRQPVDRAYSHYVMDITRGWVPERNFFKALEHEPVAVDEFWWGLRHYIRHGMYAKRLHRIYEVFAPEQVRVFLYDDYLAAPENFMETLLDFLGVDSNFRVDMKKRHNQGLIPVRRNQSDAGGKPDLVLAKPPKLSSEVRHQLTQRFRADILDLQDLIHRDLSPWLA